MTTYYPINENLARASHDMRSMSTYPDGYATREYRASVDKAAALVEEKKQKVSPYYTITKSWTRFLTATPAALHSGRTTTTGTAQAAPLCLCAVLATSRCGRSRSRTPVRIRFGTNMKKSKPS